MNNTEFSEIYHIFLNSIQDYHLKNLFQENIEFAEDMLQTFLMKAIVNFYNCDKIKNVDTVAGEFNCELTIEEKHILANFMLLAWLDYNINDITQMEINLNDSDFRHFSEEKNLEKKVEYANKLREITMQSMTIYGLHNTDFKQWAVGNYGL